jgi:hypothetical protein
VRDGRRLLHDMLLLADQQLFRVGSVPVRDQPAVHGVAQVCRGDMHVGALGARAARVDFDLERS